MKNSIYLLIFLFTASVAFAQMQGDTSAYEVKLIEELSSKKHTEFAPTISADGKTLIFESDRKRGWKLFESHLDSSGVWSEPQPLDVINDACDFIAGPSLSYDGDYLYYTAFMDMESESEDIFYSVRSEDGWGEPIKLGPNINTDENFEGFPSVSADGNSLYFIRLNKDNPQDEETGENCFVIYRSIRQEDGSWGEAEALPVMINSGCVRDPRIMADNRTLIFSAIKEGGKGLFDLYQSQWLEDTIWTEPIPLDYINSEFNDQSPTVDAKGDKMYFYSFEDLFSVGIPPEYKQFINATIQGTITNRKTGEPVVATIEVLDATSLDEITSKRTNDQGEYSVVLNAGRNYLLKFRKEGYLPVENTYNYYSLSEYLELDKDIEMVSEADYGLVVYDQDLEKPMDAWVKIYKNEQLIDSVWSGELSEDGLQLDVNADYLIVAAEENYISDSARLDTRDAAALSGSLQFYLKPEKVAYAINVRNMRNNGKVRSKVIFKNKDKEEVIEVSSDEEVFLRKGDRYEIYTSGDRGYLFASNEMVAGEVADSVVTDSTGEATLASTPTIDMGVLPVEKGAILTLNAITFESNSADLQPSSLTELDRMVELIKANPGLTLEVAAYTDDVGAEAFNQQLSEDRAASVVKYLTNNRIPAEKLVAVGYGESSPKFPNNSAENRAKNRRVEVKVLESE